MSFMDRSERIKIYRRAAIRVEEVRPGTRSGERSIGMCFAIYDTIEEPLNTLLSEDEVEKIDKIFKADYERYIGTWETGASGYLINLPDPFSPLGKRRRADILNKLATILEKEEPSMNEQEVKVGQVWKDRDPRSKGRVIGVVAIEGNVAIVDSKGRKVKIRLDRLKPVGNKKGYELVPGSSVQP